MRTPARAIIIAFAGILLSASIGKAAFAEVRKGLGVTTSSKPTTLKPLSREECATLGGDVTAVKYCNSGNACHTLDQNGQHHYLCISKK